MYMFFGTWFLPTPLKDDDINTFATQGVCTGKSILEPPNMLIFQKLGINLFERISTNWKAVGTALLEDFTGDKIEIIDNDEKKTENKNRRVLQRWLKGEGRQPKTWSTLIDVLNEVELKVLAEDIGTQVGRSVCNIPSLPYAYSEEILGAISKLKRGYRSQRIVQFDLLEKFHTTNLPFLDVILRDHDEHGTSTSDKILHNVLNDATLHKRLLITGPPGSGKTTLVRYIAKRWAEGENLQSCQILFVIYLDKIKAENIISLSDLLRQQYKDIMDVFVVSKEIYSRSGNGTCLLLDAYDEKDIKTDYITDLMFNNELPNLICILTSRPDSDLKVTNASVDILGFKPNKLDSYLETLAPDKAVKETVLKLWKDKQVKELCKLPLHMAMTLFIAQTPHASSINTKTQIYTAFMNATIKHYHQEWSIVSLRRCVLNHNIHYRANKELCAAFKMMHLAAFKMVFESSSTISVDSTIKKRMEGLGFVSILSENSPSDEVKVSFSHPTFTEFFAALHLITIPQSDQLFHVQNPTIKKKTGLIDFYFGLLGDFYVNNVSALFLPLKRYSTAFAYPIRKWEHICPRGYYTAQSSSSLRLHQEIGWKGKAYRDLLHSAGIVTHSSICLSVTNRTITHLRYLLENHGNIHQLSIVDYSSSLRSISLNNCQGEALNTSHLKVLECFEGFKGNTNSCNRNKHQSSVQQIHIRTDKFSFQSSNDLGLAIDWLKGFRKMKSFGLSIHNSSLISLREMTETLSNLNVSSIEVHCCIQELHTLMMSFPNITTLYLELLPICMSHMRLKKVSMLSSALRETEKLQNLILVPTSEMDVPAFLTGLTALKYLHVERININGSTATRLIEVASKDLVILDLSHCTLQGLAVKKLSKHLRSLSKLQNLKFSYAGLTDTDVSTLSESISELKKLTFLGLSDNKINGEGLESLVEVLKEIKSFRSLNLFGNPITGHENIIALSQMTNLRTLHISIASKDDKKALISVVQQLKQLESFRWSLV
jgi:DNA polymerase III delta prime subunit